MKLQPFSHAIKIREKLLIKDTVKIKTFADNIMRFGFYQYFQIVYFFEWFQGFETREKNTIL